MGYCTIQDIRDEGYSLAEYPDARVTAMIDLASAYIDKITGRFFEPRSITMELDGKGKKDLRLPDPPISLTTVTIEWDDGTSEEVAATDYKIRMPVYPESRHRPVLRCLEGTWPEGANIKIEGSFGFVDDIGGTNATPELVKRACIVLTAAALPTVAELGSSGGEVISETLDDFTYRLSEGVETSVLSGPEVVAVVNAFRRLKGTTT